MQDDAIAVDPRSSRAFPPRRRLRGTERQASVARAGRVRRARSTSGDALDGVESLRREQRAEIRRSRRGVVPPLRRHASGANGVEHARDDGASVTGDPGSDHAVVRELGNRRLVTKRPGLLDERSPRPAAEVRPVPDQGVLDLGDPLRDVRHGHTGAGRAGDRRETSSGARASSGTTLTRWRTSAYESAVEASTPYAPTTTTVAASKTPSAAGDEGRIGARHQHRLR